jgi:hypothetical protein
MELTDNGFYKTPRIIKGLDFLEHIHAVLDCGNKVYVQFMVNQEAVEVISFKRLYDSLSDKSVVFNTPNRLLGDILVKDIEEFEFVQYRPQTAWKAIHMGNTKRINLEQFEDIWISDTFRHLTPVIVLHQEKFWHVMGLELAGEEDSGWYIYLKRQDSDFMTRIHMSPTQKFIYNPLSNSWSLDNPTEEITDLEQIKVILKGESIREVVVSGVPMKLVRVQEIARGVLFFVFMDEEEKRRYYYARRTTKLRIVTDQYTREKKYLLDHIKAMHID